MYLCIQELQKYEAIFKLFSIDCSQENWFFILFISQSNTSAVAV